MTIKHFFLSALLMTCSIIQAQQILKAKFSEEHRKSLEEKEEKEKYEPLPTTKSAKETSPGPKQYREIVDLNEKFN